MACISFITDYLSGIPNLRIVEIGSRTGESIDYCLRFLDIKEMIAIDPYDLYDDYKHDGFYKELEGMNPDRLFENMKNKYDRKPVKFIRKYSDDAHLEIENESLDAVFIDGNHMYEYVFNDIKNYYHKVKKGGIICGDDYFMRHKNIGGDYDMKMVYEAVWDYFGKTHEIIEIGDHGKYPKSWLVKKTD